MTLLPPSRVLFLCVSSPALLPPCPSWACVEERERAVRFPRWGGSSFKCVFPRPCDRGKQVDVILGSDASLRFPKRRTAHPGKQADVQWEVQVSRMSRLAPHTGRRRGKETSLCRASGYHIQWSRTSAGCLGLPDTGTASSGGRGRGSLFVWGGGRETGRRLSQQGHGLRHMARAPWHRSLWGNGALVWDTRASAPHPRASEHRLPSVLSQWPLWAQGKTSGREGWVQRDAVSYHRSGNREAGPDSLPRGMETGVGVENQGLYAQGRQWQTAAIRGKHRCNVTEALLTLTNEKSAPKSAK